MTKKQIVAIVSVVLFIISIPFIIDLFIWLFTFLANPTDPKIAEQGVKLAIENEIPWYIGVFEWLQRLPQTLGAIAITAFVMFLVYIGAIKVPRR